MDVDGGVVAALTGAAPHPLLCKLSAILDERWAGVWGRCISNLAGVI
jgi:hypothetical protein